MKKNNKKLAKKEFWKLKERASDVNRFIFGGYRPFFMHEAKESIKDYYI